MSEALWYKEGYNVDESDFKKKKSKKMEKIKIVEITASVGKTTQIVQYEPLNVHASMKAEVPENVDLDEAYNFLFEEVKKQVRTQTIQAINKAKELSKNEPVYSP